MCAKLRKYGREIADSVSRFCRYEGKLIDVEVKRNALGVGIEYLDTFPAVVIQGARQVGKSTLARQLSSYRESTFVTLDDPAARQAAVADPNAFVNQCPDGTLIIDEVQYEPELLFSIKANIDKDRRQGRFLLTGSANLLRVKGKTDSLAGRAVTLHLRGLSEGEKSGVRDDFVSAVLSERKFSTFTTRHDRASYVETIAQGGYPELQTVSTRTRSIWIQSYLDRLLERDAAVLPSGSLPARLRTVLALAAANQSGELVKARFASQAELPQNSVTAYVDVLESIYLLDLVPPWAENLTKRQTGRSKSFVADTSVAMFLNRQTPSQLEPLTSSAIGGLFESFVASEILKQKTWSEQIFDVSHFRDRDGLEVDLVVELDDGRVIGIEVKASSTYRAEHYKGLAAMRDKLGDRFVAGFVIGMAQSGYQYADRLFGLPASALWELGAVAN